MNKILGKIYGPLVRKARKAEKNNTEVIDEEETTEPEPVME